MGDFAKAYLTPKAQLEGAKGPFGNSSLDVVVGTKRLISGEMGPGGEKGFFPEVTDRQRKKEDEEYAAKKKKVNDYYDRMKSYGYEFVGDQRGGRSLLSNSATVGTRK